MKLSQLETLVKRIKEQSTVEDPYVSFWVGRVDVAVGRTWVVDLEIKPDTLAKLDLRDVVTQDGEYQLPLKVKG